MKKNKESQPKKSLPKKKKNLKNQNQLKKLEDIELDYLFDDHGAAIIGGRDRKPKWPEDDK